MAATHVEEHELMCVEAFKRGDRDEVLQLLPHLQQPAAVTIHYQLGPCTVFPTSANVSLLHLAALHGWLDVVTNLVRNYNCNSLCRDSKGRTLLHYAAFGGSLPVVSYLITITEQHCNLISCLDNLYGSSALHYACIGGHLKMVQYLITELGCDPASPDSDGDPSLHYTCVGGCLNVVKYLITEQHCDPSSQNQCGYTPLHWACHNGHIDIIQYLTELDCDPASPGSDGDMPLHLACFGSQLNVVKYLITEQHCDPKCQDKNGRTPLHYACQKGHMNIIQYLITELKYDPMCVDNNGDTPLHNASYFGHTHIVEWLLLDGRVDLMTTNNLGHTPVDSAQHSENSYELLKFFNTLVQSKKSFPIDSFSKAVLTGNSAAGKTSLAKVITERANRSVSFLNRFRKVSQMETHTAGIIPYQIESGEVGNIVLYDLAGQAEYYSSQSAIMETVMQRSAAIFINVVDLSKSKKEITQEVHYWLNFIESTTCKTVEKSCVMMVGSHVDQLSKEELDIKRRSVMNLVQDRVKRRKKESKKEYMGFVGMDCRKDDSKQTQEFISLLSKSQKVIAGRTPSMSLYCHMLYAFLQTKLKKTACQLAELASTLVAENSPLPSELSLLSEFLVSLSDKGVIIYLQNKQHLERSWVVVDKETLLKDIIGTMFAPEDFKEHHQIASNTGIVCISSLQQLFPKYKPEMLVGFLESLEFCHRVNLSGITTNLQPISTSSMTEEDGLLLFPSLLEVHRPNIFTSGEQLSFGWCLGCRDHNYQYFTSRFLHVLLLCLAYTFPLACKHIPTYYPFQKLQRRCTVWKNGISWNNVYGIKTVVEVIEQSRWVVVAMSHNKDRPVEFNRHRSAVIKLVLDLQKQLALDLDTSECLISPSLLQQWPFKHGLPDTDLFAIEDVARSMLLRYPFILSYKDGSNKLSTQKALFLEPFYLLNPSSVCELMDNSKADQSVPLALLNEVKICCQQPQLELQSHACLRECVDELSMFAGRNPVDVAGLECNALLKESSAVRDHDQGRKHSSSPPGSNDPKRHKDQGLKPSSSSGTTDPKKHRDSSGHGVSPPPPVQEEVPCIFDLSQVPDGTLDLSHLPVLLIVLKQVYQWFDLGLQLGVPYNSLKEIEKEQRGSVRDSKREMLVAWLKGQGGEPSKQFLETALRNI